jgi:hypothetical protein
MTPKSARRFSDQVMRKNESMTPKSAQRFSDRVVRKNEGMTPYRRFAARIS